MGAIFSGGHNIKFDPTDSPYTPTSFAFLYAKHIERTHHLSYRISIDIKYLIKYYCGTHDNASTGFTKICQLHNQTHTLKIGELEFTIEQINYLNKYVNNIRQTNLKMIFVKILLLPPDTKNIIVRQTIDCIQTKTSYSWICTFTKDNFQWGIDRNTLLSMEHVRKYNEIEFHISLQIIRICVYMKKTKQVYILYHDMIPFKTQQRIQWNINHILFMKFKDSKNGMSFGNTINNNSLFRIECYPYGMSKEDIGFFGLYLQLIHLPFPNTAKIKIKFTLSCPNIGVSKTAIAMFTCKYEDQSWGFHRFCSSNSIVNDYIIIADFEILNIYDMENNEIPKYVWS